MPFVHPRPQQALGLAGIDNAEQQKRLFFFSFLYLLPYFNSGFNVDSSVVFSLVLCAVHVQLERKVALEGLSARFPSLSDANVLLPKNTGENTQNTKSSQQGAADSERIVSGKPYNLQVAKSEQFYRITEAS